MLVISFDTRRSSCFMFLKSQFFSIVIFFQCSSGVSLSSCFARKKSPRRWYVFLFGTWFSQNSCISFLILIVSWSVLNSPFVIISIADAPAPQMKSCLISGSFVSWFPSVGTVSSARICLMSILWILLYVMPKCNPFGPFSGCVLFLPVKSGVF